MELSEVVARIESIIDRVDDPEEILIDLDDYLDKIDIRNDDRIRVIEGDALEQEIDDYLDEMGLTRDEFIKLVQTGNRPDSFEGRLVEILLEGSKDSHKMYREKSRGLLHQEYEDAVVRWVYKVRDSRQEKDRQLRRIYEQGLLWGYIEDGEPIEMIWEENDGRS